MRRCVKWFHAATRNMTLLNMEALERNTVLPAHDTMSQQVSAVQIHLSTSAKPPCSRVCVSFQGPCSFLTSPARRRQLWPQRLSKLCQSLIARHVDANRGLPRQSMLQGGPVWVLSAPFGQRMFCASIACDMVFLKLGNPSRKEAGQGCVKTHAHTHTHGQANTNANTGARVPQATHA